MRVSNAEDTEDFAEDAEKADLWLRWGRGDGA
jgi:hypothetical protein